MESGCARVQIAWGPSSYKSQGVPSWMTSSGFSNCACALPIGVFLHLLKGHARLATRRTEAGDRPGIRCRGRGCGFFRGEAVAAGRPLLQKNRERLMVFPETGNRKPETGNRKPETGNRKPETGNRSIFRVALFFENRRAQRFVDAALEGRALVVCPVDASCKFDEAVTEVAFALAVADFVFNIPEFFVEGFQFRPHAGYFGAFGGFSVPKAGEHVEFTLHVGALVRVVDALELDIQNRNLVQQLAWRNGYGDGFGHVFTTD